MACHALLAVGTRRQRKGKIIDQTDKDRVGEGERKGLKKWSSVGCGILGVVHWIRLGLRQTNYDLRPSAYKCKLPMKDE